MEDCIVRIGQLVDQLAPAEARVASYMLANPHDIIGQPIDQVAAACQTSKTTVVRLCKQLGYKGYKAFSIALSSDLAQGGENRISYSDIVPGDDLRTIMDHVSYHTQAAISDTMRVLNEADLAKAVNAIDSAHRVDFYGVGASALVALDAQQKLQRLCKATHASQDPHVQVVTASGLVSGDAAVFFSYSGETEDVLDTLAAARHTGATTIAVTRYGASRLSEQADITLYVASGEMLTRSAAMTSRIAMMHVMDIIYSAVVAQGYERYKPYLDKTHLAGRAKRRSTKDRRR